MTRLTDMQLVLLATACQREDGSLLPPPASLGDQASRIRKAVTTLVKQELAREADVTDAAAAWREENARRIGVVISDAGRAVIAAEGASDAPLAAAEGTPAAVESPAADTQIARDTPEAPPSARTKQALVLDMLRAEGGTNLAEMVAATGWLPHTTRAALTGLRKKGHAIVTRKGEGGTRYHIAGVA
ncbi:DUF3489 domain-containing protein [Sphingomonas profundi]|uniref:DUF3489 domain-containing protein n=1 Tax=Alterirhizorhabdus profundi TaxID=2681549 RepID=UPI0012E91FAA|nr:DUF3489 domain-containing protein [Sphingomonas profundi]